MSIEKIKAELAKISPWPWGWHKDVPKRILGKGIVLIVAECREEHDAKFLVSAPARIAKLIAVAEAAHVALIHFEAHQPDMPATKALKECLAALEADDDR